MKGDPHLGRKEISAQEEHDDNHGEQRRQDGDRDPQVSAAPILGKPQLGNIRPQGLLEPYACCAHRNERMDRLLLARGRNWGNKPMTTTRHRLYIKRTISVIPQGISDLLDRKVHRLVEIDE